MGIKAFMRASAKNLFDYTSRVSSKESITQIVGLETIAKDSIEVPSTTSISSMASKGKHVIVNIETIIKYNMTLEFQMENSLGAKSMWIQWEGMWSKFKTFKLNFRKRSHSFYMLIDASAIHNNVYHNK